MKKILIIAIIALIAAVPAFSAVSGWAGISFGPEMTWTHADEAKLDGEVGETDIDTMVGALDLKNPMKLNDDMFGTNLVLSIEGATYFSEKGGFGIGYGLDFEFPAFYSVNGTSEHINGSKVVISPRITANYMYKFNDSIALEAGLGLAYSYQNGGVAANMLVNRLASDAATLVKGISDVDGSEHILSIVGTISAMYNITDMFALRAGVNFGFTVLDIISANGTAAVYIPSGDGATVNQKANISANLSGFVFELTPFVGAAITY